MRRDTVTVPARSHIVIRFMADNPGIWALHCHVVSRMTKQKERESIDGTTEKTDEKQAWHLEEGMLVTFVERPDELKRLVEGMDPATRDQARSFCGRQAAHTCGEGKRLVSRVTRRGGGWR